MSAAMTATRPKPTDLPICNWLVCEVSSGTGHRLTCDTVLKTPPANAWVFAWKTEVISKFEIVNRESAPVGLKMFARKAVSIPSASSDID